MPAWAVTTVSAWLWGLTKSTQASLTDRHQLIRSSWAALEVATVLRSSKLFPEDRSSNHVHSGHPTPYVLQRHAPRSHRFPKARSKPLREKRKRGGQGTLPRSLEEDTIPVPVLGRRLGPPAPEQSRYDHQAYKRQGEDGGVGGRGWLQHIKRERSARRDRR